jgi:hydroxypyruvate reductase
MSLSTEARAIFAQALQRVDVGSAVRRQIRCDGKILRLGDGNVSLSEIDRLVVVAMGKAASPMYAAAEEALRDSGSLRIEGIIVAPGPPLQAVKRGTFYEGAHPTPDERSLRAANAVLRLLATGDDRTAVLFLVSGGASAMVEKPLDPTISLADAAAFHRALVGSGLAIAEMNALRKHFSAVKGGRLAVAASAATIQATLLVSDVPAGRVDAIASGPSVPDGTTVADCRRLLAGVHGVPECVREFFASDRCVETPKANDAAFARAQWQVILASADLAAAAASAATAAGFHVEIDNTCDEWEYREAARYLLARSYGLAQRFGRSCLISVGEVGVSLSSAAGEGGRNQQFALWNAEELASRGGRATVLSAGSDGIDGNSFAAGAVCDETSMARAQAAGWSVKQALKHFNCAPLLRAIGDDIVTGPTGNNLRDLRLILSG